MAKTPRVDPYGRLIKRLYEAIYLLSLLGKSQGSRRRSHHDPNDQTGTRRHFLRNLAVICDVNSGGSTVTAIAVENLDYCSKFWVASNTLKMPDVVKFLNTVLGILKRFPAEESDQSIVLNSLIRRCTEFARPRLETEVRILSNAAKKCVEYLRNDGLKLLHERDPGLELWLAGWIVRGKKDFDGQKVCQKSYDERDCSHMRTLRRLARGPDDGSNAGESADYFGRVRRVVGRLANHVRAVQELCRDASRVSHLLENYRVARLPPPQAVSIPMADALTDFEGIMKRLIPPTAENKEQLREKLLDFDQRLQLGTQLKELFEDERRNNCVHAEIQLLDYFHLGHGKCRDFADGDKFIACSKPACFCCKLYFQNHPARCAEPDSHENIWRQWSPVRFGGHDDDFRERRNILIAVHNGLREKIFARLLHPKSFPRSHMDTATGITESGDSDDDIGDLSEYTLCGGFSSSSEKEDGPSSPWPDRAKDAAQSDVRARSKKTAQDTSPNGARSAAKDTTEHVAQECTEDLDDEDDEDGGAVIA